MSKHIKNPGKYLQEFFKRWANNVLAGQSIDNAMDMACEETKDEFVFDLTKETIDLVIKLIFGK